MILPTTAFAVWIVAIVSLLCLGSWANTLKLAGKWRFEYFYYDFVFGILLCAGVAALALGSGRAQELTFQDNLLLVGYRKMAWAMGSGVVLNLGMLLLLAAMSIAGMSVAFPLTLGVALVIGAVWDFGNATQANTPLTFIGVALLAGGVVVAGLTYTRLLRVLRDAAQKALTPDPRTKSKRQKSAGATLVIILSVVGGIALSTFPKILSEATLGDGGLAPYPAVLLLAVAALFSSPFFVLFFTTFPVTSTAGMPSGYLAGSGKQHLMGIAGGIVWGTGLLTSLMVAGAPRNVQPSALIQYVLNNGALLVAVAWGVLAWHEFRGGGDRVRMLATGMVVLFLAGLALVAFGLSPK
jgi:glucose uptake protein